VVILLFFYPIMLFNLSMGRVQAKEMAKKIKITGA
jgi:hypothetical protein